MNAINEKEYLTKVAPTRAREQAISASNFATAEANNCEGDRALLTYAMYYQSGEDMDACESLDELEWAIRHYFVR